MSAVLAAASSACGASASTSGDAALATSIVAVVIATAQTVFTWRQARAQDDQRYASVWPHVEVSISYRDDGPPDGGDGSANASIAIMNKGIGPAVVRTFRATLDGIPVGGPDALLQRVYGNRVQGKSTSTIVDDVLSANEKVVLVGVDGSIDYVRGFFEAIRPRRFITSICYCSVFDQCWWKTTGRREPMAVAACPRDDDKDAGATNADGW